MLASPIRELISREIFAYVCARMRTYACVKENYLFLKF